MLVMAVTISEKRNRMQDSQCCSILRILLLALDCFGWEQPHDLLLETIGVLAQAGDNINYYTALNALDYFNRQGKHQSICIRRKWQKLKACGGQAWDQTVVLLDIHVQCAAITVGPSEYSSLLVKASFENASGVLDFFRMKSALGHSDAILKPDDAGEDWHLIRDWLDAKEDCSVIYVAFGSETVPTQDELAALAGGLELSGLPFLWVLKKEVKTGKGNKAPLVLPDGFEERTKGRGLVWTSWAPQLRILSHSSIGGFLSHSGWSSVVEALHVGLPLILLPMFIDQGLVARTVSEWQAGGAIYRQKAKEASTTLFGNQVLQREYMDKVVEFLVK
ncbi:putative UDP-rhamnose:rhamnosyltransferase 1 [Drosera capensis]